MTMVEQRPVLQEEMSGNIADAAVSQWQWIRGKDTSCFIRDQLFHRLLMWKQALGLPLNETF